MEIHNPKNWKVSFYRPRVVGTEDFQKKVAKIFDVRWFTNAGPFEQELSQKIADYHQVKHCILVSNATFGLQLCVRALGLRDEVLTTPFSFIATPHSIAWQGLPVKFCDIDPVTLTIDPKEVEKAITPKTSGIMGVHVFGQTCAVDALDRIAKKNKLKLMYDAAHSFGVKLKGKSIGSFGDAEVLSFHATKIFHTFEGGAILTNNSDLATRLTQVRNFGITGMDEVSGLGVNAKMSEVSAAYGLSLLPHMSETFARLDEIRANYRTRLNAIDGVRFVTATADVKANGHYSPILLDKEKFPLTRDELWSFLWQIGIQTRRYFYPALNKCLPYSETRQSMPIAEAVAESVLCLPSYFDLSDEDVALVCDSIANAAQNAGAVRDQLKKLGKSTSPFSKTA